MPTYAPLNAMRAFEAAARTGSFTNAARELNVSSAAVSQQVKLLEDFWNEALFIRQGNRIALTDAGQTAYPPLAQAMASLEELSERMQRSPRPRRRFVLSVPQSVAETWLGPKLAQLEADERRASISVRVDPDPIDFVRDKVDMRVFYGHDLYGDYRIDTLFEDQLIAVAAPSFAGSDNALSDEALIHTDWGRGFASSPDWSEALPSGRFVDRNKGLSVSTSSVALKLASDGLGAALVPSRMAVSALAAGQVLRLDFPPVPMPQGYRVAYPKRLQTDPFLRAVVAVLQEA